MPRSPFGSGSVSWSTRAERVAQETLRRGRLQASQQPIGAAASGGTGGATTVTGTAGPAYTATEQTLVNALVATVTADAAIINAQAAQITALADLVNTMRTALLANGILTS